MANTVINSRNIFGGVKDSTRRRIFSPANWTKI
jgi:hypothetical protein